MRAKIYKTRKIYAATILIILAAISILAANFLSAFGISALIIAVILGAILANSSKKSANLIARSGILAISTKQILRLGIVLYGFKISLDEALSIGYAGILSVFIIVFIFIRNISTIQIHLFSFYFYGNITIILKNL